MFNLLSLALGLLALPLILLALLPFFGWANWLILPLPALGLAVGALSRGRAGLRFNAALLALAALRLVVGHGLL